MKITEAKYQNGMLMLNTDAQSARSFVYGFSEGEYEITRAKKKRSLDANAYAWVLISKIAEAAKVQPYDVYRRTVRDLGGNCEILCAQNKTVEHIKKLWTSNGLGWQVETAPSKLAGCTTLILYYGSSHFDTKEMSRFIDFLVQECVNLGIETKPKEYINSLLEAWK